MSVFSVMLMSETLKTVSSWVCAVVSCLICFHRMCWVCFFLLLLFCLETFFKVLMIFFFFLLLAAAGAPANRRGRGGGHRGRGRFNVRRDGPMKFEKDFDFESANAQFNKEEIDREFQDKLKLKGVFCLNSFVFVIHLFGWWDEILLNVQILSAKTFEAVFFCGGNMTVFFPQIKKRRSPRKLWTERTKVTQEWRPRTVRVTPMRSATLWAQTVTTTSPSLSSTTSPAMTPGLSPLPSSQLSTPIQLLPIIIDLFSHFQESKWQIWRLRFPTVSPTLSRDTDRATLIG